MIQDAARFKTSVTSLVLDSYIERMVATVGNETKEKTMKILQKSPQDLQDLVIKLYQTVSDCDPADPKIGAAFECDSDFGYDQAIIVQVGRTTVTNSYWGSDEKKTWPISEKDLEVENFDLDT